MTDEAEDLVDKWVASKKKTGYPIAILDGQLEEMLGVPHFPFNGVIGPDGKIAYAGDSPESTLKKALKEARPGSMWPKALAGVAQLLRSGKIGEAWVELQANKAGLSDQEKAVHERFSTYVTTISGAAVTQAQELVKADKIYAAFQKVEAIANAKPELPATPDAVKLVAELKALPTFDLEMKGGEMFAAALAKEEARDYAAAVNAYRDVLKKCEGAKIAAVARKQAENLINKGMPGFEPSCEKCKNQKKACPKHAKEMKL